MMSKKAIGTKFFKEGTQNQQILANYWGNGSTFTADDLRNDLDIASPGARLTELREAGFNVKATADNSGSVGRPAVVYSIPRRRVSA
jgi:predicted ArsR family transcriptional regulator